MIRRACIALGLWLGSAFAADAQEQAPLLHPLFQDHVVLQRDQPIRLWGQATPGEAVRVELSGHRARARADAHGRWAVRMPPLRAGGPHALSVNTDDRRQRVEDVMIGDVWLCSGQSNMELPVWRTLDARAEMASADDPAIRLFTVPQAGSDVPRDAFTGPVQWMRATPEGVRDFSAACYYFARELRRTIDVPMGLISASWGGSRIEAWTSAAALRPLGGYDAQLEVLARHAIDPAGAIRRWGELWQAWWLGQPGVSPGDAPWREDDTGAWRSAPRQLGAWERWGIPELAEFNGMLWYRARVQLTAAQAAQGATLVLGPADEIDTTWVNGRTVGSSYGAGDARRYAVPAGALHAGDNTVVVNVLDTCRDGGLAGPASAHALELADGSRAGLQDWEYRIVPPRIAPPPRAPWQTAAGLSTLHNAMIAPLGAFGLRGALWYQGEANTGEAAHYARLLRALRKDWRRQWRADLPLLIVQLPGYGAPPVQPGESGWAGLREAQRQVAAEDRHSGIAITIDLGDRYDIHPANKQEVARRIARVARHVVYGEDIEAAGPIPAAVTRDGHQLIIEFSSRQPLVAHGADMPIGFELCGDAPARCRYARAELRGRRVVLTEADETTTRVRYCWADNPVCTLFDQDGLPAGPFERAVPRIEGRAR